MRWRTALAATVLATALAGCGDEQPTPSGTRPAAPSPAAAGEPDARRTDRPERRRERAARPPAPSCRADAGNCAAASGTVIALESVDPDGDGDLHVVLAGGDVTLPGITVLDVSAALRPAVDPRIGDWAAGAGPVYTGSYGQRQIEVTEVVFDPPR